MTPAASSASSGSRHVAGGESLLSIFELLTGRRDSEGNALGPRREPTRERIVAAATEQLLAHGYRQMRVDDVAAAASVSRPTLYAYFESKESLLIAAMSEEAMGQLSEIGTLFDPEPMASCTTSWTNRRLR